MCRLKRVSLQLLFVFSACIVFAQTQTAQRPKVLASDVLTRARSAVSGGTSVRDVALTGRVRRIAGSTDESGEAELKAVATGAARFDLSFPSGPWSEVYTRGERGPVGEWSGADRKAHAMAYHNLLVDAAWFCPALVLERASMDGRAVSVVGRANSSGDALDHLRLASPPTKTKQATLGLPQKVADVLQKASEFDLYIDAVTFLPTEMNFQAHPDNDPAKDIPIRIRYSDYRPVHGVQVPFHMLEFISNRLYLDLQIDAASFNIGLTADSFVVSAQASRSLPQ